MRAPRSADTHWLIERSSPAPQRPEAAGWWVGPRMVNQLRYHPDARARHRAFVLNAYSRNKCTNGHNFNRFFNKA